MTINIFVSKGDLNGENRSGAFLFCRVYIYIEGSQIKFSIKILYLSLKIVFVLANSVDPMRYFIHVFTVCLNTYLGVTSIMTKG